MPQLCGDSRADNLWAAHSDLQFGQQRSMHKLDVYAEHDAQQHESAYGSKPLLLRERWQADVLWPVLHDAPYGRNKSVERPADHHTEDSLAQQKLALRQLLNSGKRSEAVDVTMWKRKGQPFIAASAT